MFKIPFIKTTSKGKKSPLFNFDKGQIKKLFGNKDAVRTEIISLVIILAIIIVYFILSPINASYKETKVNVANLTKEKETLIEKKGKLTTLSKDLEDKKVFISEVEDILPKAPQVPEALLSLEQIAKNNSLYITTFIPTDKGQGGGTAASNKTKISGSSAGGSKSEWSVVEIQFDLIGDYPSIAKFLKDLEKNIRPVDIKSIRITGGGEISRGIAQPLRFSIVANIFYQP